MAAAMVGQVSKSLEAHPWLLDDNSTSKVSGASVLLRAFAPLPSTLCLSLPSSMTISHLSHSLNECFQTDILRVTNNDASAASPDRTLASLATGHGHVELQVRLRLRGGKGGFGSMLRAQGGKMSAKGKDQNTDSCRDLNGRRLSTMKQAKQLAAYIAEAPAREAALNEAQAKKYAKLEKMLGRKPKGEADFVEAANRLAEEGDALEAPASPSSDPEHGDKGEGPSSCSPLANAPAGSSRTPGQTKDQNGKRQRLDDHEYVEQSREIVEGVRSAVATAMLKKKRKLAAAAASKSKATPTSTDANKAQKTSTAV